MLAKASAIEAKPLPANLGDDDDMPLAENTIGDLNEDDDEDLGEMETSRHQHSRNRDV